MKFNKYGSITKFVAFLLFLLILLTAVWSLLGVGYMASDGYYRSDYSFSNSELSSRVTREYADMAFHSYFRLTQQTVLQSDEAVSLEAYKTMFSKENTNFIFTIYGVNGTPVLSNDDDQNRQYQQTFFFSGGGNMPETRYMLNCSVREPLTAADNYAQPYRLFQTLFNMRHILITSASAASLLSACLFVYLMYAAGRRDNGSEIVTTWQHRVPLDILAVGLILAGYVAVEALKTLNNYGYAASQGLVLILPVSFVLIILSFFVLAFCMNLSVRIKKGKWWRNTVIYKLLTFFYSIARKLFSMLPMIWKAALLIAGYLLANILLTGVFLASGSEAAVLLWLLFNFAVFVALCFLVRQMKMLKRAGAQIAEGDYSGRIDTSKMIWDMKQHAENMNNIGAGMSKAVDARMKSERLKTELITNVSHDLKTPLTSIISYIDLLKKETIKNEKAEEYIAVLERQSSRLKKLTEDLLEASKAATGNISVTLGKTDLVELVNQSMGEYAERFEACGLEAVFRSNREEAAVYADGKLLWRVLDNLLNNICKYSLRGTRIYISIDAGDDTTKVSLLNISSYPLNINADELLERFVRGDASRSTDGSGLGLSIAKSLTELQSGSFELCIEGDLFKTVMTFKTLQ